jgi:GNAT superfamily N-acetyltransferase
MAHDPVVESFWPRLYEVYSDFQLWVVDHEERPRLTVGYACSVPVRWNGTPSERGVDWALTEGVEGAPTTLCAVVAGVLPEYRGFGIAEAILQRLGAVAAGHGLDALVAPVRPTWKERYPLVPLDSYVAWRRGDGLPYDPWLRTHERLGGEQLATAPRSMTIALQERPWHLHRAERLDAPSALRPASTPSRHCAASSSRCGRCERTTTTLCLPPPRIR